MNKKGYLVNILVGMMFLMMLICLLCINLEAKAKDLACKELGYEEYTTGAGLEYCRDNWGNVIFVKTDCKGFFNVECSAHKIKVGEVIGTIKE